MISDCLDMLSVKFDHIPRGHFWQIPASQKPKKNDLPCGVPTAVPAARIDLYRNCNFVRETFL